MSDSLENLQKKNKGKRYAHFGAQGSMKSNWIWKYTQTSHIENSIQTL